MGVIGKFDLMDEFPGQAGEGSTLHVEEVGCERPCDRREHETRPVWLEGKSEGEHRAR